MPRGTGPSCWHSLHGMSAVTARCVVGLRRVVGQQRAWGGRCRMLCNVSSCGEVDLPESLGPGMTSRIALCKPGTKVFPVSCFGVRPGLPCSCTRRPPSLLRATTSTSLGVLERVRIRHLGHTGLWGETGKWVWGILDSATWFIHSAFCVCLAIFVCGLSESDARALLLVFESSKLGTGPNTEDTNTKRLDPHPQCRVDHG